MASIAKQTLSGAVNGNLIGLTTGTATVHTAVTGTVAYDEIHVYCNNYSVTDAVLTLGYAGNNITFTIPSSVGLIEIVPNLLLNNGGTITASASANSALNVGGFVNRITL
jgi:hypothetical protein